MKGTGDGNVSTFTMNRSPWREKEWTKFMKLQLTCYFFELLYSSSGM